MSKNIATGRTKRRSRGRRVVAHLGVTVVLLLASAGPMVGAGSTLGWDESRTERISGDDDPILIPRSAVPLSSQPGALDVVALDPDTTGSVEKPAQRSRPRCTLLAWFPDRPSDREFEETC